MIIAATRTLSYPAGLILTWAHLRELLLSEVAFTAVQVTWYSSSRADVLGLVKDLGGLPVHVEASASSLDTGRCCGKMNSVAIFYIFYVLGLCFPRERGNKVSSLLTEVSLFPRAASISE